MNRKSATLSLAAAVALEIALSSTAHAQQYAPVSPNPPIDPMFQGYIPPPIEPMFQGNIAPPMDMTDPVQRQVELFNESERDVKAVFNLCIKLSEEVREKGGDPGNCGGTQDQMQQSINQLTGQYYANNRAAEQNSQITQNSVGNYDMRAVRGCVLRWNQNRQLIWVCP